MIGAILSLDKAEKEISEGKYKEKHHSLMKAHDIVFELIQSLDQDKGKKIAVSLLILYDFVIREIMDADTNLNTKAIDNAKGILSELRKSWKDMKTNQDKEIKDTDNIENGTDLSG